MKRLLTFSVLILAVATPLQADEALINEARQQTKQLAMQLKATLKKSMKSEGPEAAVAVCNLQAPVIADKLSMEAWQVGRTSLKWRNEDNAPDAWEVSIMQDFAKQVKAGADPKTLEASRAADGTFRYMKAIPTGGVCLACHGENIAQPIAAKLDSLYPSDQARGFKLGQLRGAFTLTKQLKGE